MSEQGGGNVNPRSVATEAGRRSRDRFFNYWGWEDSLADPPEFGCLEGCGCFLTRSLCGFAGRGGRGRAGPFGGAKVKGGLSLLVPSLKVTTSIVCGWGSSLSCQLSDVPFGGNVIPEMSPSSLLAPHTGAHVQILPGPAPSLSAYRWGTAI